MAAELILASASPRRSDLLARAGLGFRVRPTDVDESFDEALDPEPAARLLARRKLEPLRAELAGSDVYALGADTIVALPRSPESGAPAWRYLAKPVDAEDAGRMLRALSGSRHQVVTGIACLDAAGDRVLDDAECTWVSMRAIAPAEVEAYVASGEWRGKAGGYAIQETADAFVTSLEEGGFDNVVGLPVARALALLERAGAPLAELVARERPE